MKEKMARATPRAVSRPAGLQQLEKVERGDVTRYKEMKENAPLSFPLLSRILTDGGLQVDLFKKYTFCSWCSDV